MQDIEKINNSKEEGINTKHLLWKVVLVVVLVVGFYFLKFNDQLLSTSDNWYLALKNLIKNLSDKPEVWGQLGDYIGGILNPIIAGFALYLIAESYKLQKTELQETRKLLEVSTNAQQKQVKLAALTALLNTYLTKVSILQAQKEELHRVMMIKPEDFYPAQFVDESEQAFHEGINKVLKGDVYVKTQTAIRKIDDEIDLLNSQVTLLQTEIMSLVDLFAP